MIVANGYHDIWCNYGKYEKKTVSTRLWRTTSIGEQYCSVQYLHWKLMVSTCLHSCLKLNKAQAGLSWKSVCTHLNTTRYDVHVVGIGWFSYTNIYNFMGMTRCGLLGSCIMCLHLKTQLFNVNLCTDRIWCTIQLTWRTALQGDHVPL